jgi:hypothetical protein
MLSLKEIVFNRTAAWEMRIGLRWVEFAARIFAPTKRDSTSRLNVHKQGDEANSQPLRLE